MWRVVDPVRCVVCQVVGLEIDSVTDAFKLSAYGTLISLLNTCDALVQRSTSLLSDTCVQTCDTGVRILHGTIFLCFLDDLLLFVMYNNDPHKCAKCLRLIQGKQYLRCSVCEQLFDLQCANVSVQRFNNTLIGEHGEAWQCPTCTQLKLDSNIMETPLRPVDGVNARRRGVVTSNSPEETMDVSLDLLELPPNNGQPNLTAPSESIEVSQLQTLIDELRLFRQELMGTRTQMQVLNNTMLNIATRIGACETRVSNVEERIDALERRIDSGLAEAITDDSLLATVEELKTELNDRDQELLINDIEISCIPERKGESLSHIALTLATILGVKLIDQDIVSTRRVGNLKPPAHKSDQVSTAHHSPPPAPPTDEQSEVATVRPRPIVLRVARRTVRDELLQAARVRREATYRDPSLPDQPPVRFYVNERLTRNNRQVFHRAREISKRLKWKYVWSREGKVYVRQSHGAPRYRLRTEADLSRVFGPGAVCPTNES